ncbi:hypothetical protein HanXRQr2_Chr03g0128311 [Helianthus annuus]|uniref:Uncharacterized protein n=1 Tax=Helianthus annuus TaxID=4232 RepID=A0A9K3NX74_HELAN|nr:hypothetical protein HanXRQr2_Chr03g0128311 [Helianthus annuus]KAJ0945171.1 hypothetical protein HanPSC8_Chr03g0125111 [Helianthus annuus]
MVFLLIKFAAVGILSCTTRQTKKLTFRGAHLFQVNPRPLSSKTLASILFLKLFTEKASELSKPQAQTSEAEPKEAEKRALESWFRSKNLIFFIVPGSCKELLPLDVRFICYFPALFCNFWGVSAKRWHVSIFM